MARAYSLDLRERVVAAVAAGLSCREVARRFKVSVGRRQERSLAPQRAWILARLDAAPDVTLRALVVELGERGVVTSYGSVWRIVHDAELSFKKNPVRNGAASS
jgi:transposase